MLSVIIPTRNRAELLRTTLNSLHSQTLSVNKYEIIVVDNGSSDHTKEVISSCSISLKKIRYVFEAEPGLHSGRHRGLKEAKGDILVFADDDIEALPSWLTSIIDAFTDKDVAMVGGNNYPLFLDTPPGWLIKMWNKVHPNGYKAIPLLSVIEFSHTPFKYSPSLIWGCNFAIRKDVLLKAGGFHPDGMPKDLIRFRGDGETHVSRFVEASGMKSLFHSGASVYHKVTPERMTYEYFRQRGFNQGVSDSYTRLRSGDGTFAERRSLPYRAAKWGWKKFRLLHENMRTDTDVRMALEEMKRGHAEGYAFHQHAYKSDKEVREWVHREHYLK